MKLLICISTVLIALVILTQSKPSPSRLYMNPAAKDLLAENRTYGEDGPYFEGDIMLTEEEVEQLLTNKVAPVHDNNLWTNNKLYYKIEGKFTPAEVQTIMAGIDLFNRNMKGCVRILPRLNQKNYVAIINADGCSSQLGMIGGRQTLKLGGDCFIPGSVTHEFIHAFGFKHEQTRPDRDNFVIFHKGNLTHKDLESQFKKYKNRKDVKLYGFPYNYESIMHYGPYAFARKLNGKLQMTLEVRQKGKTIGQRDHMSKNDTLMIRKRYGC